MIALRHGWIHLASGAGFGRIFGFLSNVLLSRWLGPFDLGVFNLVTTTVQTSDTLVRCGADYAFNYKLGGHPERIRTQRGFQLATGLAQICTTASALICVGIAFWLVCVQSVFPASLEDSKRFLISFLLLAMIFCEGTSVAAWEILLVSRRTNLLALKQGLFVPLRLLFAAAGGFFAGVIGALIGWCIVALSQLIWLRFALGDFWRPFQIHPFLLARIRQLLRCGLPFYGANLLSSLIFYYLLVNVAYGSGIAEIGYLKAGQILQQLFAFLPATLVPILFLKLRSESSFSDQVIFVEKPFRVIWLVLIESLLLYCILDRLLITLIFGGNFLSALQPTRMLLLITLFECLAQLLVQPLLASGKIRLYGYWQNGSALLAALLGVTWVPSSGLYGYLVVRLIYSIVPLLGFGMPVIKNLREPSKIIAPILVSIVITTILLTSRSTLNTSFRVEVIFSILAVLLAVFQWQDIFSLRQMFANKT